MKYLPTINVWNSGIINAIRCGQLKLQCGQWITCGTQGHKSRYVGLSSAGTIYAAHWEGEKNNTSRRFKSLRVTLKLNS